MGQRLIHQYFTVTPKSNQAVAGMDNGDFSDCKVTEDNNSHVDKN